ncbi:carbon-nitrogen hydrolase [Nemania sp. FL0031]|nr:carbon-nitrogen hydrolase [Nemania sp. FL0031]
MVKAAIGQICSSISMVANLAQCVKLMGQAAKAGAKDVTSIYRDQVSACGLSRRDSLYVEPPGEHTARWLEKLKRHGKSLGAFIIIFLPEASDYIATSAAESLSLARPVGSSPFVTGLQTAAAEHSIAVHVGIHVPVAAKPDSSSAATTTKLLNRTIYISSDGSLLPSGSYDKLHLFDYANLRESASTQAGSRFTPPFPSPIGRLGSLICFDLRFPEPALHLTRGPHSHTTTESNTVTTTDPATGTSNTTSTTNTTTITSAGSDNNSDGPAQVLLYPSAFTVATGRAHWEVLLRARAIETQSYVIAAAQVGAHNVGVDNIHASASEGASAKKPRVSYGHSMVVDPWGRVVLEMKGVRPEWDGERSEDAVEEGAVGELGVVDIDLGEWERVREKMPLVRRTDVYPEL